MPRCNFCERVRADDEENLRCGPAGSRGSARACSTVYDGPVDPQLVVARQEPGDAVDRESRHREAVKRRGERLHGAMRRHVRRERSGPSRDRKASRAASRGVEMAAVNRVERPSEKTDAARA